MNTSTHTASPSPAATGAAALTVLLVEDEEAFIDALTVGLRREGLSSRSLATAQRRWNDSPRCNRIWFCST